MHRESKSLLADLAAAKVALPEVAAAVSALHQIECALGTEAMIGGVLTALCVAHVEKQQGAHFAALLRNMADSIMPVTRPLLESLPSHGRA